MIIFLYIRRKFFCSLMITFFLIPFCLFYAGAVQAGERGTVPGQIKNLELWKEITIGGNHYTFLADEKITVCPDGYEQEEEEGPFTIDETAKNVTFKAGEEIIFKDGFVAKKGSDVHVYTETCTKCPDEDKNPKY